MRAIDIYRSEDRKAALAACLIAAIAAAAALLTPMSDAQPALSEGLRGELRLGTTGEWQRFPGGGWNVKIYGTFDGATATMETRLLDGSVVAIDCANLVGQTDITPFVYCTLAGEHRINISGGIDPSISWEARRVEW